MDVLTPADTSTVLRASWISADKIKQITQHTERTTSQWLLVLRPHPRNEKATVEAIEAIAKNSGNVLIDNNSDIDNVSLLRASSKTMSMGSTVGAESVCLGTAAAYFEMGWDYSKIEAIMHVIDVPRIRDNNDLLHFLTSAPVAPPGCKNRDSTNNTNMNIENYVGATERAFSQLKSHLQLDL